MAPHVVWTRVYLKIPTLCHLFSIGLKDNLDTFMVPDPGGDKEGSSYSGSATGLQPCLNCKELTLTANNALVFNRGSACN